MEIIKRITNSFWGKCISIALIVIVAFAVRYVLESQHEQKITNDEVQETKRETDYAKPVEEDNHILKVFQKKYPDAEVLLACEEDVTDDGNKDLVVICRIEGMTRTIVVIDSGDNENYQFSTPIPGPVENQKIQFKNIDKEGEIEIIITGEKKGAVGYAIYRMIDGEPVDLFGEGMEDCC